MTHADMIGDIGLEPCHSFLMAAKYDFMSHSIKTGSLVYLNDSSDLQSVKTQIVRNVKFDSQVRTTSLNTYSTDEDNSVTTDKPYRCYLCLKGFCKKQNLKLHTLTHTGVKPFECGTHLCKTCEKQFRNSSNLKSHTWIHTGVKPYLCKTCGKQFTHLSSLRSHEVIHTCGKLHSRGTCGKQLTLSSYLKKHERTHSGVKPFKCDKCNK